MSSLSIVPAFQFNDVIFDVVDHNGQPWLKSSQLATALGYAREDKVTRLYSRNADEFTENMTQLIDNTETPTSGFSVYATQVRIFSLRGCHLIAMFARTAVVKAFRKWVLDVLDSMHTRQPEALPLPDRLATKEERKPLTNLVNILVGCAPLSYRDAWKMIHVNFSVESADALTVSQIQQACQWAQDKIDSCISMDNLPADCVVFRDKARMFFWAENYARLWKNHSESVHHFNTFLKQTSNDKNYFIKAPDLNPGLGAYLDH